jgi:hypothetical protein
MFDLSTRFIRITTSIILYNHYRNSVLFSEMCFLLFFMGRKTEMIQHSGTNANTKSHFLFSFVCRGADSQAMDRDGRTALQYAIDSGTSDEDILALLEDHSR